MSAPVVITNRTSRTVVVYAKAAPGPAGPSGGAASTYEHTQSVSSASWVINHNLGYRPNVSVSDGAGNLVISNVVHHSINQVELQFNSPITGSARLT